VVAKSLSIVSSSVFCLNGCRDVILCRRAPSALEVPETRGHRKFTSDLSPTNANAFAAQKHASPPESLGTAVDAWLHGESSDDPDACVCVYACVCVCVCVCVVCVYVFIAADDRFSPSSGLRRAHAQRSAPVNTLYNVQSLDSFFRPDDPLLEQLLGPANARKRVVQVTLMMIMLCAIPQVSSISLFLYIDLICSQSSGLDSKLTGLRVCALRFAGGPNAV